eukprot:gene25603-biopygen4508
MFRICRHVRGRGCSEGVTTRSDAHTTVGCMGLPFVQPVRQVDKMLYDRSEELLSWGGGETMGFGGGSAGRRTGGIWLTTRVWRLGLRGETATDASHAIEPGPFHPGQLVVPCTWSQFAPAPTPQKGARSLRSSRQNAPSVPMHATSGWSPRPGQK